MGIMFGMFSFAFWVFSTPKCEALIFTKFVLACMNARSLKCPYYLEHMHHAHVCMLSMPDVTSHMMQTTSS